MKLSYGCIVILSVLALIVPEEVPAASVPPEVKSTVGFVYILNQKNEKVANGTGFFVGVKNPEKEGYYAQYFVTAKHVLKTPDHKSWLLGFFLRLNKRDGTTESVPVPITLEGKDKTILTHPDPDVDLVAIPMLPDQKTFDFKFLPDDMLTTKKDFDDLNIREGSDVFFTGLFSPYPGYEKNYPVVRFGRVALITDEKIEVEKGHTMNLYLVESASFGGNSGSPVFFQLGSDRNPGSIIIGPHVIKIAGVMMGSFQDIQPIKIVETAKIPVASSSMGISCVTPAYKLHELLFGKEAKKSRGF